MRILHVTAMKTLSPNSGIPTVLKGLVSEQNKFRGIEAMVLSLNAEVSSIDSEFFHFIGDESVGSFLDRYAPSIVIIHSFYRFKLVIISKELLKRRVPFFVEPHGSFGKQAMKKSIIKKYLANLTVFRHLIKKALGYIFTNEAEMLDSVYRTKNDIVIPNGIWLNALDFKVNKNQLKATNVVFYYLGRYDIHHKGLDYLIDALKLLDQNKISIVVNFYGTGNKEQIGFIRDSILSLKHIKAYEKGPVFGNDKKVALESSNILLLTSRYEGSPMTVLDALCYGNPCLVTPGTNIADEVANNELGWKAELSAQSIADTIILAREQYMKRADKYINQCKNYVAEHYSWERIAEISIKSIESVLHSSL